MSHPQHHRGPARASGGALHRNRHPSLRPGAARIDDVLGLMVARKLHDLRFPLHVAIPPSTIRRDETLLLLAALALGILAISSLSLLRLLGRLQAEWDGGRT